MKKTYFEPTVQIVIVESGVILQTGSGEVKSNNGIDYGGVDENGSHDPASRRRNDQWEDEEEDESF